MGEYRKRPVIVEAYRWDGTAEGAAEICEWMTRHGQEHHYAHSRAFASVISIATLEGMTYASAGDWVIRGVRGEFYPCKPDIFDATHEEVAVGPSDG